MSYEAVEAVLVAVLTEPANFDTGTVLLKLAPLEAEGFIDRARAEPLCGALDEIDLRLLHAQLRILHKKIPWRMSLEQARLWGFGKDIDALTRIGGDYSR